MAHVMGWIGTVLLGLFFTVAGASMLVWPQAYFRWVSRLGPRKGRMIEAGSSPRWMAIELWTRFRGALLLAAMAWVAYHGYLRIR